MEIEGQYLTYSEYQELGGTLDQTPFNLLEFEARKKIDEETQMRLKDIESEEIPQEVKLCIFNIIDKVLKAYNQETTRGISSETVGSYSVTYDSDMKNVIKNKNAEINDLITTDLFGVIVNNEHLIYRGVK